MNIYEFALIFALGCFIFNSIFNKLLKKKKKKAADKRKEWYRNYLKSEHWKKRRARTLKQYGYKCAICGSREHLEVHHLTYKNIYHEKDEDLKCLCRGCHKKQHMVK